MQPAAAPIMELRILDPRLHLWGLPRPQSEQAAAIDLHACLDAPCVLPPGGPPELISAGLAVHIADPQIAALVLPRSGLGHRKGLVLGNLVGLIDPDYTGPIRVSAWNRNPPGTPALVLQPGERFAQSAVRADPAPGIPHRRGVLAGHRPRRRRLRLNRRRRRGQDVDMI